MSFIPELPEHIPSQLQLTSERLENLHFDTILRTEGELEQLEDLSKEAHEINYLEVITVQTFEQ